MANIPNYISEIIPYTRVLGKKGSYRASIGGYIARSKFLISNEFGVDPDRVHDIFMRAWDKSEKDYPSPSVIFPQNSKEAEKYNSYILYIWKYYVVDNSKLKPPLKEPKLPKIKKPKIDDLEQEQEKDRDNPYASDDEPSMLEDMGNAKPKKGGAIAISGKMYEGTRGDDLVNEEIDERILRLLKLDDVFDIDYDTYIQNLKAWALEARMTKTEVSSEESELITEEYKRVKRKVGRFKINKRNVDRGSAPPLQGAKNFITGAPDQEQKALSPSEEPSKPRKASLNQDIAGIRKTVESILKLMEGQYTAIRKQLEKDRNTKENKTRGKKEDNLEKKLKKTASLAKKILVPTVGLFERIFNFLKTVFIGRVLYKLVDYISKKENQGKIKSLIKFIGDWWPALLAGVLLFTNPMGRVIRTVLGTIAKLTLTIAKKGIPKLLNLIKKNPYAAAAIAVGVGGYVAATQLGNNREKLAEGNPEIVKPGEDRTPGGPQLRNEEVMQRGIPSFAGGGGVTSYSGGGLNKRRTQNSSAGKITGSTGKRIKGAGKDTQLIAAQPGEVVISKKAVDKFGAPFFLNLNKMGGGTNKPSFTPFGSLKFAGGGLVPIDVERQGRALGRQQYTKITEDSNHPDYEKYWNNQPGYSMEDLIQEATKKLMQEGWRKSTNDMSNYERNWLISNDMMPKPKDVRPSSMPMHRIAGGESGKSAASNMIRLGGIKGSRANSPEGMGKSDNSLIIPEIKTPSTKSSAPFSGALSAVKPRPKNSSPSQSAQTKITKPSLEVPPPPTTKMNIISTRIPAPAPKSQGSVASGTREIDEFSSFYQTESRLMNIQIYGLLGVE